MKRCCCLILSLMILLVSCPYACGDAIDFDPKLTNSLNETDFEWNDSSLHRVLLVLLLMLDIQNGAGIDSSDYVSNGAIVGSSGDLIYTVLFSIPGRKTVMIMYIPLLDYASYTIMDNEITSSSMMKQLTSEMNKQRDEDYYYISHSDLVSAAVLIKSVIEN